MHNIQSHLDQHCTYIHLKFLCHQDIVMKLGVNNRNGLTFYQVDSLVNTNSAQRLLHNSNDWEIKV